MATNGITTLGTRTFLFGGASGIDTSALITAAYNQRKAEADKIDVQISDNTARMTAIEELQTLGQAIQTNLADMKKNYSILAGSDSLFDARTGTLASSSTTDATNLVTVAIDPGTTLGSYEIEVQQKAQAHRVGGNSATADKTANLGYTGTFDIAAAGGTATTINVTSDMSLEELATAINAQSTTTGVGASVLKVSESGYQLLLTATNTNKAISVTNITGNDVLQNLGVLSAGGAFVNELQPAQGALIEIDGVPIARDDNDFSDVITGINLTVKNAEPGTILQLNIENDTSTVKDGILNLVDSYNALREAIAAHQVVSDTGEVADEAVLFGDSMLKTFSSAIQGLVGSNYGTGGGNLETLAELGLTLGSDGVFEVDESTLDNALLSNFDEVRDIFETQVSFDNTQFRVVSNTSKLADVNIALDITYSGGAITNVAVGGDNSLFTINGTLIQGATGSIYEGLSFAYVGTSSTTVNLSIDQGFADLMNSTLEDYVSTVSGLFQQEKVRLDELNGDLGDRADRVLERADDYRERLIEKYASYEAQIAAAQTTLAQLQAILGTNNDNNN
ncbi:MAG: flagellar filament capping protein FliD [Pseudobdellovibrionaceae bacterium]